MWTFAQVRRRSVFGLIALALRGGAGKIANAISVVALSRLLAPTDFGVFAILQLPVGLASLLADAGVSAALIQRRDVLTPADERAGFTLRVMLALALSGLLILAAGPVGRLYGLDDKAIWVLRIYSMEPLISAPGVVPGVRLTRALRFDQFAWVETIALVIGQATTIGLAWSRAGLWSFVAGALVTSATGTMLVNILAPWRPRFGLPTGSAKSLLRFGLAYHGRGLAHLVKDKIIPTLGGLVLSSTQVGYLSWAQEIARWPRLPADYVARVGFPAFARLQSDPDGLSRLLQNALVFVCTLSFSSVAVALALNALLVRSIFGPQWEPAAPLLLILLAQTPLDALIAVLLPLIYATGRAKQGLSLSLFWTVLTWSFSLSLLWTWHNLREMAIPVALGLSTLCAAVLVVRSLPKTIHVRWRVTIGGPLLLALVLGTTLRAVALMFQ